jgi:hypothetical protein
MEVDLVVRVRVEGLVVVVMVMAGVMVGLVGEAWVGGWAGMVVAVMVKVVTEVKVGMEVGRVEAKGGWEGMVGEMGLVVMVEVEKGMGARVERVEEREAMGRGVGMEGLEVKVVVLVGLLGAWVAAMGRVAWVVKGVAMEGRVLKVGALQPGEQIRQATLFWHTSLVGGGSTLQPVHSLG